MGWRAITEEDLRSVINEAEDAALRTAMLAVGQGDPFATASAQVTGYSRNAIRSGPGNRLDPDATTLPEGAIMHASGMLAYRLFMRFAAELMTDDHRRMNKDAEAWLKEVRAGRERIEQPDDEPGETNQPTIEHSSQTEERQWTRRQQSGLF